ncbi:MAG: hypothetical protein QOE97_3201 [Pseudonocardiales bacterium]|jgi:hypothetical protein|nr:hypothetical protein [Pseudonocardiales bacterium]
MTTARGRRFIDLLAVPRTQPAAMAPERPVTRWTVACTAMLPTVLTSAWLIAGALQPPDYSPVRQTVSVLAGHAGSHRWIMTSALYVVGAGYLVTAALMTVLSAPCRAGLVLAGAAAIGVASFPQPEHGTSQAHAVCTGIGAITLASWPAVAARQHSVRAALGARVTNTAIVVSALVFFWTFIETRDGTALGLAERVSSVGQACWPLVVALALRGAQAGAQPGERRDDARDGALDAARSQRC